MRLTLIRHGQSEANVQGLVTGLKTYDGLSTQGIEQMRSTAGLLQRAAFGAARLYTSDFRRAQQSAALVWPGATFTVDARLGETDAGDVAGWPMAKFLAQWPHFYGDPAHCYPGGESHEALNQRVLSWLADVRAADDTDVLAVTHAGPITCLLQHALGIPMSAFPALLARNASLSIIEYASADDRGKVLAFSLLPEASLSALIRPAP